MVFVEIRQEEKLCDLFKVNLQNWKISILFLCFVRGVWINELWANVFDDENQSRWNSDFAGWNASFHSFRVNFQILFTLKTLQI
jgi:hypothetical protein